MRTIHICYPLSKEVLKDGRSNQQVEIGQPVRSVFADNTPDVDITFMIPFLQRPTDHYMVGVDNLTISLSALGLLEDTLTEPDPKDIIMQVIAKRKSIVGGGPALGPSLDRAKGDHQVRVLVSVALIAQHALLLPTQRRHVHAGPHLLGLGLRLLHLLVNLNLDRPHHLRLLCCRLGSCARRSGWVRMMC